MRSKIGFDSNRSVITVPRMPIAKRRLVTTCETAIDSTFTPLILYQYYTVE